MFINSDRNQMHFRRGRSITGRLFSTLSLECHLLCIHQFDVIYTGTLTHTHTHSSCVSHDLFLQMCVSKRQNQRLVKLLHTQKWSISVSFGNKGVFECTKSKTKQIIELNAEFTWQPYLICITEWQTAKPVEEKKHQPKKKQMLDPLKSTQQSLTVLNNLTFFQSCLPVNKNNDDECT